MEFYDDGLRVIPGNIISKFLTGKEEKIIQLVREAYISHQKGESSLPHSIFLRFPEKPQNRIIGLPGYVHGAAGMKWVASFPDNITRGIDRASATIILNSLDTGRPYAILEGSTINAKRTAASAALAAKVLSKNKNMREFTFIGCGFINFEILKFLITQLDSPESISIFDLDRERASFFAKKVAIISKVKITIADSIEDALRSAKIISFATTASTPHVLDASLLQKESIVLHISLRDLGPDIIKNSVNVVDDLDHVNRENTSIYVASQAYGNTDFITASLGELLLESKRVPNGAKPVIFSPFGLGILDIALARFVYEQAVKEDAGILVKDFTPPNWREQ